MEPGYKTKYNAFQTPKDGRKKEVLTIEEILDRIGFGRQQIRVGLCAGIVWISDGMETMVVSILGPTLAYEWHITAGQQALLSALVFVGFFLGSPFFGYLSDNYGRRTSLILSSVWTLFYGLLCVFAPNYEWMLILRLLLGLGLAGGMQLPSYYTELLPTKQRGKLTLLSLLFWAMGGLLSVAAALALMRFGWRYWLLMSAAPALIFLLFSPFLPESPRYELACDREDKAIKILKDLAKENGKPFPNVEIKKVDIKPKGNFRDLFTPKSRKLSILIGCVWFGGGFLYYGVVLFSTYLIQAGNTCSADLGLTRVTECNQDTQPLTTDNYIEMLWTSSSELPGLLVTLLIIDTVGRKWGSLLEVILVGVCLLILNICMGNIPMLIVLFAGRGLAVSVTEILYLYTNEVYPTEVRSLAVGSGSAMARVGGVLTPIVAQVVFQKSMYLGLIVYIIVALFTSLAFFLLPVETKGKPMEESFKE